MNCCHAVILQSLHRLVARVTYRSYLSYNKLLCFSVFLSLCDSTGPVTSALNFRNSKRSSSESASDGKIEQFLMILVELDELECQQEHLVRLTTLGGFCGGKRRNIDRNHLQAHNRLMQAYFVQTVSETVSNGEVSLSSHP